MGRYSTGIMTTDQSLKIDLSYLLKNGFLKKNKTLMGTLSWSTEYEPNLGSIQIQTFISDVEAWIRLIYVVTDLKTGIKTSHDDKVYLETIKSNLGKGELHYFICPTSGQRCKILYRAYGSNIWKSREAYSNRIYYSCQKASKLNYANERYWSIDSMQRKANRNPQRHQTHYKGQPTKRYLRESQLDRKKEQFDMERWNLSSMSVSMRKAMATGLYDDMIPRY
jgi:hypothetical protein